MYCFHYTAFFEDRHQLLIINSQLPSPNSLKIGMLIQKASLQPIGAGIWISVVNQYFTANAFIYMAVGTFWKLGRQALNRNPTCEPAKGPSQFTNAYRQGIVIPNEWANSCSFYAPPCRSILFSSCPFATEVS